MQKIISIYFSATGNTARSLTALAEGVAMIHEGVEIETVDITCQPIPKERSFGSEDFVLLGMPVYAGRLPLAVKDRLLSYTGHQTPCIVAVTYGNREYEDALLELADMATQQGFILKGAAALIGRHTYGEIQVGRPDVGDLAACRAFGKEAVQRKNFVNAIPGNRPYRAGIERGKFRPLTRDSCAKCGLCVHSCPIQAISDDCKTVSEKCLSCFRCIRNCPVSAKHMDIPEYQDFVRMFSEKLKVRKENEFF